jgi:hypothetical protein
MLKRTSVVCAVLASLAGSALPISAATFDVNQGLWGDGNTPKSFAWAIDQANAPRGGFNPLADQCEY